MAGWVAVAMALAVLSVGLAEPLRAQQPLNVIPRRDLDFGDVFAGVARSVSRLDPGSSGMYEVRGARNAEVTFTFTLPDALLSSGGQTLPIQFGPDDAGFSQTPNQQSSVGFDPRVGFTARLSRRGRAFLWLGGTVLPAPNQAPGVYQAPVTLTVEYTGN